MQGIDPFFGSQKGLGGVPNLMSFLKRAFSLINANKAIISNTAVYTLSSGVNALIGFILLPILTRYLSPTAYGIVETFSATAFVLTGVVLFGGNTLLAKEFFRLNSFEKKREPCPAECGFHHHDNHSESKGN